MKGDPEGLSGTDGPISWFAQGLPRIFEDSLQPRVAGFPLRSNKPVMKRAFVNRKKLYLYRFLKIVTTIFIHVCLSKQKGRGLLRRWIKLLYVGWLPTLFIIRPEFTRSAVVSRIDIPQHSLPEFLLRCPTRTLLLRTFHRFFGKAVLSKESWCKDRLLLFYDISSCYRFRLHHRPYEAHKFSGYGGNDNGTNLAFHGQGPVALM